MWWKMLDFTSKLCLKFGVNIKKDGMFKKEYIVVDYEIHQPKAMCLEHKNVAQNK